MRKKKNSKGSDNSSYRKNEPERYEKYILCEWRIRDKGLSEAEQRRVCNCIDNCT